MMQSVKGYGGLPVTWLHGKERGSIKGSRSWFRSKAGGREGGRKGGVCFLPSQLSEAGKATGDCCSMVFSWFAFILLSPEERGSNAWSFISLLWLVTVLTNVHLPTCKAISVCTKQSLCLYTRVTETPILYCNKHIPVSCHYGMIYFIMRYHNTSDGNLDTCCNIR